MAGELAGILNRLHAALRPLRLCLELFERRSVLFQGLLLVFQRLHYVVIGVVSALQTQVFQLP